jgi:hypothetical protein
MDASDYSKVHGVDLSIHSLETSNRITKTFAIQKQTVGWRFLLNRQTLYLFSDFTRVSFWRM